MLVIGKVSSVYIKNKPVSVNKALNWYVFVQPLSQFPNTFIILIVFWFERFSSALKVHEPSQKKGSEKGSRGFYMNP